MDDICVLDVDASWYVESIVCSVQLSCSHANYANYANYAYYANYAAEVSAANIWAVTMIVQHMMTILHVITPVMLWCYVIHA